MNSVRQQSYTNCATGKFPFRASQSEQLLLPATGYLLYKICSSYAPEIKTTLLTSLEGETSLHHQISLFHYSYFVSHHPTPFLLPSLKFHPTSPRRIHTQTLIEKYYVRGKYKDGTDKYIQWCRENVFLFF